MTAVLLMAAGAGNRLGAGRPKALASLGSSTILEHAFAAVVDHPDVSQVVVVAPIADAPDIALAMHGRAIVISGGATRQDSVRLALDWLAANWGVTNPVAEREASSRFVLVHDAARPFVPAAVIDRVLAALRAGADCAVPALPVSDTIKRVSGDGAVIGTLNRAELRAVQTPQGFVLDALVRAHAHARTAGIRDITDDAGLIERHGGRVVLVQGADEAFKITHPWDLRLAELLARSS